MKILYFINHRPFFVSHRLPIALKMKSEGHSINLLTGICSDKKMEKYAKIELKKKSIKTKIINFKSSSINIFKEIFFFIKAYSYIKQLKPDLIHSASMKTNIVGGLCALLLKKPLVIAFSGFGYVFTEKKNLKVLILKFLIIILIRIIFMNKNKHIIVQNSFDLKFLKEKFNLKDDNISKLNGSGIVIKKEKFIEKKNIILFPARVLAHKGINEFIKAATYLKKKYTTWKFVVIGSYEYENPAKINLKSIQSLKKKKIIEFLNHRNDIKNFFLKSKIVCLPTYREGLPKSLIEACSMGLPIVTTNIPGCELVVKNNYNGFKVPIKNVPKLILALEKLIKSRNLRNKFGKKGLKIAKDNFNIENIIKSHIKIYKKLYKTNLYE